MSRIPIRLRLTLAFALAMAIVLVATGAFLYFRLGSSLDETLNESLEARAAELAQLRGHRNFPPSGLGGDESFVQVIDSGGIVVEATSQVGDRPVLGADELAHALERGRLSVERTEVEGIEGRARLLAVSLPVPARPVELPEVLVVGTSLEERDEALGGLLSQLLVIGPVALVLASLLGYGIATAALRPVESMRAEADTISGVEPGRRLPLPRSRDEIRRLGETLNEMLARLDSALERERSFVANASHELRTPLALLKAELELALRRPRTPAELEQSLRSAAVETDRLARLAEDLLVLARSDEQQLPLQRETVRVRELLARVAERYRRRAEANDRSVDVTAPDGLHLEGDVLRLEQALGNVVDNALRHGGGAIRLSAVDQNGSVELHVVDEGSGFPPDFLPHAFERFSRSDEARTGGGAGLGLAIVAVIAEAHGGSARAVNRDGAGADVWLSLPKR
jgi:two-component system OmpR family sensor kinase